eukprot:scaffold3717_cov124-Isochrysis_galbana.AAC.10
MLAATLGSRIRAAGGERKRGRAGSSARLGGGVVAPLAGKWRHGLGSGPGLGLRRQGQRAAARGLASVGGRPTHRRARAT